MDQSHHLLQVAQELMDRYVPVPPPFHRTPRIYPDLTSWIGSGGVPGPELTRRFGFFTTVRHRCRRSSSPTAPYTWLKKLVSTPESTATTARPSHSCPTDGGWACREAHPGPSPAIAKRPGQRG